MIRSIPFNFRNNAEKTRDTVERVVDFIMEQPLNPIGKVTGALASFRCDILEISDDRCGGSRAREQFAVSFARTAHGTFRALFRCRRHPVGGVRGFDG